MTQGCRNCGSTELYKKGISLRVKRRRFWSVIDYWVFDLQVCADCGLTDWFVAKRDLGWVKRTFSRVDTTPPTLPGIARKRGTP